MTTLPASTRPARGRRSFADLGVNVKVLAAVSVAALVALLVGINGIRSLSDASAIAQHIYHGNLASVKAVGDIQTAVTQARTDLANQALSPDAASTAKFTQAFETDLVTFDTALTAYRASASAGDPTLIDQVKTNWAAT
jgi:methyl-accepting chemotaxis protein